MQNLLTAVSTSTEQCVDAFKSEQLAAPQPIDPSLLQQIGGGAATDLPGHGW